MHNIAKDKISQNIPFHYHLESNIQGGIQTLALALFGVHKRNWQRNPLPQVHYSLTERDVHTIRLFELTHSLSILHSCRRL